MPKRPRAESDSSHSSAQEGSDDEHHGRTVQQMEAEHHALDAEGEADVDPKLAKLRRKLARAVRRGDEAKVQKYVKKLISRGVSQASIDATKAGDEYAEERALRAEAAASAVAAAPAASSSSGSSSSSSSSAAASARPADLPDGIDDPNPGGPVLEGYVRAKNGKLYLKVRPPKPSNTNLLLFYAYVKPHWTPKQRLAAINFTHGVLSENNCTGRLRVALEGFNATLTGPPEGITNFCNALQEYDPEQFGQVDFKVTPIADNQKFKFLKVFPVNELVTYGFDVQEAPLECGGVHLKPAEWDEYAKKPNTVLIDVRNANETAIGYFKPPPGGAVVLDPRMRRSTEFPDWVKANYELLSKNTIMMCCTAGIRCERASALLGQMGLQTYQLEGGIHRYLDAFPEDGSLWVGKNYVFDKRFNHGAKVSEDVGKCAGCHEPWSRYQARARCTVCKMETLLCKECQKANKHKDPSVKLLCWLCEEAEELKRSGKMTEAQAAAAAAKRFAASGGGRDGEGEGRDAAQDDDETYSTVSGYSGGGRSFGGSSYGSGGGFRGGRGGAGGFRGGAGGSGGSYNRQRSGSRDSEAAGSSASGFGSSARSPSGEAPRKFART